MSRAVQEFMSLIRKAPRPIRYKCDICRTVTDYRDIGGGRYKCTKCGISEVCYE